VSEPVINDSVVWKECIKQLQTEILTTDLNIWITPLHIEETDNKLLLLAPNEHVCSHVEKQYLQRISNIVQKITNKEKNVFLRVGSKTSGRRQSLSFDAVKSNQPSSRPHHVSHLNPKFTLEHLVVGKSNQLANAAAMQIAQNIGVSYNPLFLYGGVGLGKTHLMQGVGHLVLKNYPNMRVLYISSEQFIADMIKALQHNKMNEFKKYYRAPGVLLIDDIQFFSGKDRSQEELFHTFNVLLDREQQMIFTCDRYPKEITGVTERLKSRFGWGLTVSIDPPEFEMRVAILEEKARELRILLPNEVAFFIAKHIQSNVRELEGALKRVGAHACFTGQPVSIELAKDSLKDLLTLQAKLVTVENIQRTVAEYFKIKVSEILSKRRNRSFARPRQIAMALAKDLTDKSLPEIGNLFGGRDHTTVLYAWRKIQELRKSNVDIAEDYQNLLRILSA
jgi:chromosomal replication initiator protein